MLFNSAIENHIKILQEPIEDEMTLQLAKAKEEIAKAKEETE